MWFKGGGEVVMTNQTSEIFEGAPCKSCYLGWPMVFWLEDFIGRS